MKRNHEGEAQLASEVRPHVASNGMRIVSANALQSSGDQMVNASTVLPWLFAALGVPAALTGLLVPIREAGSMLPQAFITPLVLRIRYRKWVFIAGALIQASAVGAMALIAALAEGLTAGISILVALLVFSLGRCFSSISSKDVQGRTVPKGERGQLNGLATTAAGFVAITLGLGIRVFGGQELSNVQLAWFLAIGAALWVGVSLVYIGIREPRQTAQDNTSDHDADETTNTFVQMYRLLRDDKPFRHFVTVRSLLLVSSLSPPFMVTLSIQYGADSLAGLGGFVMASGIAALIGGRLFGRMADRSSKQLMSIGAGVASTILLLVVIAAAIPDVLGDNWFTNLMFIAAYFLLTLLHTGVRVGRKTYVVDMAEGDQRTTYVAVSNTALGIVLLVVGGISSLLATFHVLLTLIFLAVIGLVGVFAGSGLPEVSKT
ncbi:MAG: MFS transporter [Yaniella sp.]|nr:MFS transporter [Yaniella sp.]MDN5814721.1 MFS transporter [Yaniella sp.]MDN6519648.1 MFS transporter [Yaniella sp.]MDN6756999.1 MFS transporter [Yaniella sp.]